MSNEIEVARLVRKFEDSIKVKLDQKDKRITELERQLSRSADRLKVAEEFRPLWSEGYSSDSAAAQVMASKVIILEQQLAEARVKLVEYEYPLREKNWIKVRGEVWDSKEKQLSTLREAIVQMKGWRRYMPEDHSYMVDKDIIHNLDRLAELEVGDE